MKYRTDGIKCLTQGALGVVVALSVSSLCSAQGPSGCEESTREIRHACWFEAQSDYFLALAIAKNMSDEDAREKAIDEAAEELEEARTECGAQYEARINLCDELDEDQYDPDIDPADFTLPVTNSFFPLPVGSKRTYEKPTDEGLELIIVEVLDDTIEIMGVTCQIVQDRVFLDGDLIEDTFDYYVQRVDGSVW